MTITNDTDRVFVLRQEENGWLSFDPISHECRYISDDERSALITAGRVVRTIRRPPVTGAMTAPIKIFLNVSNHCNLACEHCSSSSSPSGSDVAVERLHRIVEQA